MSIVLLFIGIVMVVAGVFVFYIGNKKDTPNKYLWAGFPILHGLHEFAEYALDFNAPFIVEQFEEFFAFAGAFVLLAAAIEYNDVIPRPMGKFAALIGLIAASYFIFFIPEVIFEEMEHYKFDFGIVKTNPLRFFQGVFITILVIITFLSSALYLFLKSKGGLISIDVKKLFLTTGVSVVLLLIYAFFEGFESDDTIFITLKAVSLSLLLVIPVFFILVNTVGLQRLLVIQEGGVPLLGFDFSSNSFISFNSSEGDEFILAAGFLSAVSSFSGNILKAGSTFSIRSRHLFFVITKIEGKIYALQSLHINKDLEKNFFEFGQRISNSIEHAQNPHDLDLKNIESEINNSFSMFY